MRRGNRLCLAIGALLWAVPATAAEKRLQCPPALTANPPAPFERIGPAQTSPAQTGSPPFATLNIVEGPLGAEAVAAPAALVPDVFRYSGVGVVSNWDLVRPPNTPMTMVCSYRDTGAYLRAAIPDEMSYCEVTLVPGHLAGFCR